METQQTNGQYRPIPLNQSVVPYISKLSAAGSTYVQIAERLTKEGFVWESYGGSYTPLTIKM